MTGFVMVMHVIYATQIYLSPSRFLPVSKINLYAIVCFVDTDVFLLPVGCRKLAEQYFRTTLRRTAGFRSSQGREVAVNIAAQLVFLHLMGLT